MSRSGSEEEPEEESEKGQFLRQEEVGGGCPVKPREETFWKEEVANAATSC